MMKNVMREQGREDAFVDPLADIDTINLELILADLESVNKTICACRKDGTYAKDKESVAEFNVLQRLNQSLKMENQLAPSNLQMKNKKVVKGLFL